jgi:cold shock CspA family protein
MEIGLIEWFDDSKGFGLIKKADKNEVFLHISNWKDSINLNAENKLPILFNIGFQRNKTTALDCKYFDENNPLDWQTLLSIKEHNFLVQVKYSESNLLQLVFNSLNSDFNSSIIKAFLNEIIENLPENELLEKHHWIFKTYQDLKIESLKTLLFQIINFRINKLHNNQILQFWKEKILSDFEPSDLIFTNSYKEIKLAELNSIKKNEIRNILIIKKVQNLFKDFNLQDFLYYDKLLNLIETENLKTKITNDLIKIANTHYLGIINQKIEESTKNETISIWGLKEIISNQPAFLDEDFLFSIKKALEEKIIKNCSFRIVIDCWNENLIVLNSDFVKSKVKEQNSKDLEYFLNSEKVNTEQINIVLQQLLKLSKYEIVLDKSKIHSAELFEKYDKLIFNSIEEEEYFVFWRQQKGEILPEKYLNIFFNHLDENYQELENWLNRNIISIENAKKILQFKIKERDIIKSRFDFYTLYNAIKSIIKIDKTSIDYLISIQNPSISLILWQLKIVEEFDFETLKGKFIYFKPDDQVNIFKRLFYLKHNQKLDFNLEKLDEILRADLDLYLSNEQFNNDFVLDISTHIIIECIKSYIKSKSFVFESDLILKDLRNNQNKKFKIEHYFDKCKGRLTADWKWNTEGKIIQVFYDESEFYYAIEFEPGRQVEVNNNFGSYTYFEKNPNFENLKEEVKKIPNRKWNPDKNHWEVPSSNKEDVYLFAKKNRFFIELNDKRHYDNNVHLVQFTRNIREGKKITDKKNIPSGIIYCEGRKANKEHNKFKREFWWCTNQECFDNSCDSHITKNENTSICKDKDIWEDYTLLDFLHILKIDINENNGIDLIEDGEYFKFLGHINAFNRLLDRLYCEECNNLIYPKNTSHFALFSDIRFYCIEETCSKKHQEIYLNNCLYGECKTIIDSRISKRCKHGLFICHNCGTCCSEDLFKRRLANLRKVGSFVHEELIYNVEKQNGHLEKKEYYCYNCAGMMTEINENTYKCTECKVEYNLDKFKWLNRKWTQAYRRRDDYPIFQQNRNNNEEDNFPF